MIAFLPRVQRSLREVELLVTKTPGGTTNSVNTHLVYV